MLAVYGVSVEIRYAAPPSREVSEAGGQESGRSRPPRGRQLLPPPLGQEGPGHISPLGAYDAESDRFLILDVSRYKAPAVWVSTGQLFRAMAQPLGAGNARTPGFLLIRTLSDVP